jgi:23S rRNA (cytidine1920-2'-O)/16S rRNA (cytidine1409-2'-O)-methyltransferase
MTRIDVYLTQNGFSKSRESARRSIEAGLVTLDGATIKKASFKIDETLAHDVECIDALPYVGRGGLKLEAALDAFGIDPSGKICADIGASTGGFTDCLLKRGAIKVFAIDSGRDQLDNNLRHDPRVVSLEGVNARFLNTDIVPDPADIIVMDVSFISQTLIIPRLAQIFAENGAFITLIKPQFECGREAIGKGGVVKQPRYRLSAVRRVTAACFENGLYLSNLIRSPIVGGDGNVEFLALYTKQNNVLQEKIISGVDYN